MKKFSFYAFVVYAAASLMLAQASPATSDDIQDVETAFYAAAKRSTSTLVEGYGYSKRHMDCVSYAFKQKGTLIEDDNIKIEEIAIGSAVLGGIEVSCINGDRNWELLSRNKSVFRLGGLGRSIKYVHIAPTGALKLESFEFKKTQSSATRTYEKGQKEQLLQALHLAALKEIHLSPARAATTAGHFGDLWSKLRGKKDEASLSYLEEESEAKVLVNSLSDFGRQLGFTKDRANGALQTISNIVKDKENYKIFRDALALSYNGNYPRKSVQTKEDFFAELWQAMLEEKVTGNIDESLYSAQPKSFLHKKINDIHSQYDKLYKLCEPLYLYPDRAMYFVARMLNKNSDFYNSSHVYNFKTLFGDGGKLQHHIAKK